MDKDKLYEIMTAMVPIKSDEKKDYRNIVSNNLKEYYTLVTQLDFNECPAKWCEIKKRLKQLIDGINRAMESEYKGIRHSAFTSIKNQLDGYQTQQTKIKGLALNETIYSISQGMVAYKMRKVSLEEQRKLKREDMFHIPLNKRGLVETQRYSVPGYPCIYLAHRIYGCWEEMGRSDFGTVMVSKFETQKEFKLLDLRIPSKEMWKNDMVRCLLIFPLVIASMVQVKNSKDTYKPEYLIPQLLTEWIISKNIDGKDDEKILGIIYTSAQKNDDFDFPEDSYTNYAIPVLKPLGSNKYCKRLKDYFKLTAPTYYDLEVLKRVDGLPCGQLGLSEEEQKEENMMLSHFGKMEEFLQDAELEYVIE